MLSNLNVLVREGEMTSLCRTVQRGRSSYSAYCLLLSMVPKQECEGMVRSLL